MHCVCSSLTCSTPGSCSSQDTKCFWHSSLPSIPPDLLPSVNFSLQMVEVQARKRKNTLPTELTPNSGENPLPSHHPIFWLAQTVGLTVWGCKWGKGLSIFLPPFTLEECPISEAKTWIGSRLFISTQLHLPCIYGNSSQILATGACQSWVSALWALDSCCLLRYFSGKLGKYISRAATVVPV